MHQFSCLLTRAVSILGLFLLAAGTLPAQPLDALIVGERYRVSRSLHSPPVIGRLVKADSAGLSVALSRGTGVLFTPIAEVRRVQASQGDLPTSEAFWRGARVGALVGLTVGAVATALAVQEDRDCDGCYIPITPIVGVLSVVFTGATTLVGGGIGVATRERWRTVWPPQ